jgi:hypothetical protein
MTSTLKLEIVTSRGTVYSEAKSLGDYHERKDCQFDAAAIDESCANPGCLFSISA